MSKIVIVWRCSSPSFLGNSQVCSETCSHFIFLINIKPKVIYAVSLHNNRVVFVRRPCTMADQLSPDEKLNLITRNLQVGQTNKNIQSRRLKSPSSSPHLSLTVCTAGGPWRGEGEAGSPGERAEGVLGHSDHRQAPRRLLRPHVQDRRLPQGRVWGGYVHLSFRKEFRF